jgi:hypothetical protein
MRPARVGEVTEEITGNRAAVARLRDLAARVKRWVGDNEITLTAADPALPASVVNRLKLVWKPLLAIADRAGGAWPERARQALEADRGRARDPNLGEQLLLDIRSVIAWRGKPVGEDKALPTKTIVQELAAIELRTWTVFGKARQMIRDTDIARLLAPYEVRPVQVKLDGINRNGYRLTDLDAAIARYIASDASMDPDRVYLSTSAEKPSTTAASEGRGQPLPETLPSTSEGEVDPTSTPGSTCFSEEKQSGRQVEAAEHPVQHTTSGNGLDPNAEVDAMIAGVAAGTRCAYCHCKLGDNDTVELIGDKAYHADACAIEARKKAPPKKPSLIKRPPRHA